VLAISVPLIRLLFHAWLPEVMGVVVFSAVLAHTGWHWMLERGQALIQYDFVMPVLNAAFAALVLRWAMLGLIIIGAMWVLRGTFSRLSVRSTES